MRILFYAPLKPLNSPVPSGDREIARGLMEFLVQQGHEVQVLSQFRSRFFWRRPKSLVAAMTGFAAALWKSFLFRPDAFFTYHLYYKAPDPFSPFLACLWRKPHYVFEGMYGDRPRSNWTTWPGWWLTRFALTRAAHVFSDKTEDLSGLRRVLSDQRVSYVPPSLDLRRFRPRPDLRRKLRQTLNLGDEVVLIGVAMLRADRKSEGVTFLLSCLAELRSEGLSFHYLHVGGGQELARLTAQAKDLLHGDATFLGQKKPHEIAHWLNAGDIFAFPGLDESFGLVFIEAQASALPVVAFANGGVPEAVIDGKTALLTPVFAKEAMKNSLRRLIVDPNYAVAMGQAGLKNVTQRFDRERNYQVMHQAMIASAADPP